MSKNGKKRVSAFNTDGVMRDTFARNDQSQADEKNKYRAKNDEPEKFIGSFMTSYMTTKELETKVNSVMSAIFEDYYGCIISANTHNAGRAVNVDLFFKPKRESTLDTDSRAFIDVKSKNTDPNESRMLNLVRQNTVSARRATSFELTDYAAQILWDFLPDNITKGNCIVNGKKIDWRDPSSFTRAEIITETTDHNNYGTPLIYYGVNSIDIIKLLGFIYGTRSKEDNTRIMYDVNVARPASNVPNVLGANWVVTITQMTDVQYTTTMQKLGENPNMGRLPINIQRK